jgi:hypothetical protein
VKRRERILAGFAVALAACAALTWPAVGSAGSNTITIAASSPSSGNCFPFGGYLSDGPWGPYMIFVYKDIPAFHLIPGDVVAFDLATPNDTDNRMDIAMAAATANGNDVNSGPFKTIATNGQTPANPRGDSVPNNYELQWTPSSAFDFAGGGLLFRFSNPASAFATDDTCDAQMVKANSTDPSGFFVERVIGDPDGNSPWGVTDSSSIGQFRVSLNQPSNEFTFGKVVRNKRRGTAQLPIDVPGPGTLTLNGQGVKAKTASGSGARTSVDAAGTVKLAIRPKGKVKRKLLRRHRARVRIKVTFTPNTPPPDHPAGVPRTQNLGVKLIRRG